LFFGFVFTLSSGKTSESDTKRFIERIRLKNTLVLRVSRVIIYGLDI